jgi:hypothetical protein
MSLPNWKWLLKWLRTAFSCSGVVIIYGSVSVPLPPEKDAACAGIGRARHNINR